jgi:transcription elongation factor GreB
LAISSPYITAAGLAVLKQELDALWLRRRDVVKALSAAAAEGDRSENAEDIKEPLFSYYLIVTY